MNRESLGPLSGLAADRPIVTTLALTFGATALAVVGLEAPQAAPDVRFALVSALTAAGAVLGLPLAAAALAPAKRLPRMAAALGLVLVAAALAIFQPTERLSPALETPSLATAAALGFMLIAAYPFFAAASRLGFVSVLPTLLGLAAVAGLLGGRGEAQSTLFGPLMGVALASGAVFGLTSATEFAAAFCRGSDRRISAGAAAGESLPLLIFAASLAVAAFGAQTSGAAIASVSASLLAGGAVLIPGLLSLLASAGALSLRRPSEMLAVDENRRRQAFRLFWRPIRAALSVAASNAVVAIAAILVIAIAFTEGAVISIAEALYLLAAGALAGLVLFSLRSGLFVFFTLLFSVVVAKWIWRLSGAPVMGAHDEAAALLFAGALLGQLALAWREARNPRLNARETTEAAMGNVARLYIASAFLGMASFAALSAAGVWRAGAVVAAETGVILTLALLLAPALMTTLSSVVRRELN